MPYGFFEFGLHLVFKFIEWPNHGSALMGGHEIDHGKERHVGVGSLGPICTCRAFVPRRHDDLLIISRVVVRLRIICGVVAIFS